MDSENESIKSGKREDYLDWEDYFMALALLASQRSKDPETQVGACIVSPENKVIGLGYNGFPVGCDDDAFPWGKGDRGQEGAEAPSTFPEDGRQKWAKNGLDDKNFFVCHAELNAILNKNQASAENCRLYVSLFPCCECAKAIIQSKIKEVIYLRDTKASKKKFVASKKMFDYVGIKYRQFIPKKLKVVIDLNTELKPEDQQKN